MSMKPTLVFILMLTSFCIAAPATNKDLAQKYSVYDCVPIASKPALPEVSPLTSEKYIAQLATPNAFCPLGLVPEPIDGFAAKGIPGGISTLDAMTMNDLGLLAVPNIFYYAGARQDIANTGAYAYFSQHSPAVQAGDHHSLAEIAVESRDLLQIVEVGWTVAPDLYGDQIPRLFVYHWVNGQPTCYNGCGWVQVSTSNFPGQYSPPGTSAPYAIVNSGGNWWVMYNNDWMGYFPGSLWGGLYNVSGTVQWFGEVDSVVRNTHTDMGSGVFGERSGAALMSGLALFVNNGWIGANVRNRTYQTNRSLYRTGQVTQTSFGYGGPGVR
jgi:hypothetical protein